MAVSFPKLLAPAVAEPKAIGSKSEQLPGWAVAGLETMTAENWPLIGPMKTSGAFLAAALSGYGSMAACGAGSLAAGWVMDAALPDYAPLLSGARSQDAELMRSLFAAGTGSL
jgi:glycine/D-amino acid oxidase-like deaminating enzyme